MACSQEMLLECSQPSLIPTILVGVHKDIQNNRTSPPSLQSVGLHMWILTIRHHPVMWLMMCAVCHEPYIAQASDFVDLILL